MQHVPRRAVTHTPFTSCRRRRFLQRWLDVACTRMVEELVGVRTMAMLGRFRRRLAVAALVRLVNGDVSGDAQRFATLFPGPAVVRVCKLMVEVRGLGS